MSHGCSGMGLGNGESHIDKFYGEMYFLLEADYICKCCKEIANKEITNKEITVREEKTKYAESCRIYVPNIKWPINSLSNDGTWFNSYVAHRHGAVGVIVPVTSWDYEAIFNDNVLEYACYTKFCFDNAVDLIEKEFIKNGGTFCVNENIKKLGAKWDRIYHYWEAQTPEIAQKIREILKENEITYCNQM